MFFCSHGGLLFVGQGWCVGILPPSLPAANPPPSKREALLAPSLRELAKSLILTEGVNPEPPIGRLYNVNR